MNQHSRERGDKELPRLKWCKHCRTNKPALPSYFKRAANRPGGLYGVCKACDARARAERIALMTPKQRAAQRKRRRDWTRDWRDANRERARARWRADAKRRTEDPATREHDREMARFRYWLARETEDADAVDVRSRKPPKNGTRAHFRPSSARRDGVDPAPFVTWLLLSYPDWSLTELAGMCGIPERRLRGWAEYGEGAELATIDRALTTGLGRPDLLNTLYPLEEATA